MWTCNVPLCFPTEQNVNSFQFIASSIYDAKPWPSTERKSHVHLPQALSFPWNCVPECVLHNMALSHSHTDDLQMWHTLQWICERTTSNIWETTRNSRLRLELCPSPCAKLINNSTTSPKSAGFFAFGYSTSTSHLLVNESEIAL